MKLIEYYSYTSITLKCNYVAPKFDIFQKFYENLQTYVCLYVPILLQLKIWFVFIRSSRFRVLFEITKCFHLCFFCLLWEIFVTYFDMTFLYIFLLDIWHRGCGRISMYRHYTDTKTVGVHWWLAKIAVWDDIQLDSIWPNPLLFVCPVVYPFANDPWRLKHTL